jgi:hypothetical protein
VLTPVNSLVADEQTNERVAEAFGGVLARLDAGQALQLYVQAQPLAVGELLAREAQAVAVAANVAQEDGEPGLAVAMRRLGVAVEHSLRTHCEAVAAMSLRHVIVVPWRALGTRRAGRGGVCLKAQVHERAIRDSLRHTDGLRRDLDAMGLTTRPLEGREILDRRRRAVRVSDGLADDGRRRLAACDLRHARDPRLARPGRAVRDLRAHDRADQRDRSTYLAGQGPSHEWAGRYALVVDEAWKLIESRATGRWFNELARRSRHLALWLIGISQQLSDFDNEHGRALLANASMRLFLRQDAKELSYMRETLGLTGEQLHAISSLQTSKRQYATAFLMNGSRGSGTVSIRVSDLEYWIATSDPVGDEPVRRRALRDAEGDPWEALRLLASPEWHETSYRS